MIIRINGQEVNPKDIVKGSYNIKRERVKIKSWRDANGKTINEYFPIKKISIAFALAERKSNAKLIQILSEQSQAEVTYYDELAQKWIDGIFDIVDCTVKHKYDSNNLTWYDATTVTLKEL